MTKQIEEGLKNGIYQKMITRFSYIGVTDSNFSNDIIGCNIIWYNIYDNTDKLIFMIEKEIGLSSNYYSEDVFSCK